MVKKTYPKLDYLLVVVCLCLFVYQFGNITRIYLSYSTITAVDYVKEEESALPAIYFCLWRPYSIKQMLSLSNETCDLVSDGKDVDYNETMKRLDSNTVEEMDRKLMVEYVNMTSGPGLQGFLADESFLEDVEFNITNNKVEFSNGSKVMVPEVDFFRNNNSICGQYCSLFKPESYVALPTKLKCFAFFTADSFDKHFNGVVQMGAVNWIQIRNRNLVPPYFSRRQGLGNDVMLVSATERNEVPKVIETTTVQMGSTTEIKLNKVEIFGLEPPYVTSCKDYRKESLKDGAGFRSQSHCIAQCKFQVLNPNVAGFVNLNSPYLFNVKQIKPGQKFSPPESCYGQMLREGLKAEASCKSRCPVDCIQTSYQLSVAPLFRPETSYVTVMALTQNGMPNVEIHHRPEMSFLSYLGTIGGLGGLWLGASILTVFRLAALFLNFGTTLKAKKVVSTRRKTFLKFEPKRYSSQQSLVVSRMYPY